MTEVAGANVDMLEGSMFFWSSALLKLTVRKFGTNAFIRYWLPVVEKPRCIRDDEG